MNSYIYIYIIVIIIVVDKLQLYYLGARSTRVHTFLDLDSSSQDFLTSRRACTLLPLPPLLDELIMIRALRLLSAGNDTYSFMNKQVTSPAACLGLAREEEDSPDFFTRIELPFSCRSIVTSSLVNTARMTR